MGLKYDPGAPVFSRPGNHVLICGKSGIGKGVRILIPTLETYAGSVLAIDPKGENAAITARHRRQNLKQTVHILNPWGDLADTFKNLGFAPATFNPLDMLDKDDPNAVAVAQSIADAICPTGLNAKDPYWTNTAASILTAVLLWLAEHPGETKTLARAREITSKSRKEFTDKHLIPMAATGAFDGAIRENAAPLIDLANDTYSSVMSNLTTNMRWLSDARVKQSTSSSSFSMGDLAARPTTVFLVIPFSQLTTQKTWLRLLILAGMTELKKHPGRRCMFLIDELPALGHIPELPSDLATMRGFGVDFTLTVQNLSQLKANYGDQYETIISNCGYKWFCGLKDLTSAKYLSDSLGKMTVRTTGKSSSEGSSGTRGTENEGTTWGETGRSLMTPDEVLSLGDDIAILLDPTTRPHYLKTVDYWRFDEAFRGFLYFKVWRSLFDENPFYKQKSAR